MRLFRKFKSRSSNLRKGVLGTYSISCLLNKCTHFKTWDTQIHDIGIHLFVLPRPLPCCPVNFILEPRGFLLLCSEGHGWQSIDPASVTMCEMCVCVCVHGMRQGAPTGWELEVGERCKTAKHGRHACGWAPNKMALPEVGSSGRKTALGAW